MQYLREHRLERVQCAGHVAIIATTSASGPERDVADCPRVWQSGFWPDAPGLRLECNSDRWEIQSDFMAISPVCYAASSEQKLLVSTRSDVLAAIIDSNMSMDAIVEHLRLGFLLDDHTLFEDVNRIRDGEKIIVSPTQGKVIPPARSIYGTVNVNPNWSDEEWVPQVAEKTAERFRQGMAIQMSGGVDSRIVLALAIRGGQLPAQAITLGDSSSEEVEIAREICQHYGMEHIVTPFIKDSGEWLFEDAKRLSNLRGFASANAATYASFLRILRDRETLRNFPGEAGGLGGNVPMACTTPHLISFLLERKGTSSG